MYVHTLSARAILMYSAKKIFKLVSVSVVDFMNCQTPATNDYVSSVSACAEHY